MALTAPEAGLARELESHFWTSSRHTSWKWGRYCPGCDRESPPGAVRRSRAWKPQPCALGGQGRGRCMRKRMLRLDHGLCSLSIFSSSDNPVWDKDTFPSFTIQRALSPFHRLPEEHFLSQSRPPLFSS